MRRILGAMLGAGLLAVAGAAQAMTLPSTAPSIDTTPAVTLIAGCHRSVDRDEYGPHRHVGPQCDRVDLGRPRRRYEESYEPRYYERRRPRDCRQVCNYIGPIKQCETVCR